MKFPPNSTIPVASVCLRNAVEALADAKFALREAFAHLTWYRKHCDQSEEWVGIHFARFFTDDTALRLYSAGEHLANAIVNALEVEKRDLDKYRRKNRIGQQVVVGHYLLNSQPESQITAAVKRLVLSKDWLKTIRYRNDWVHNQPPTLEGVGIVYERRNRWVISGRGRHLPVGGGDAPKHTIDNLLGFIQPSLLLLNKVLSDVMRSYVELLRGTGITVTEEGLSVSL